MLKLDEQNAIIHQITNDIPQMDLGFRIENINVEVISGIKEGLYLWISVNYLLGRFDPSNSIEIDESQEQSQAFNGKGWKWVPNSQTFVEISNNDPNELPDTYMCLKRSPKSRKLFCRPATAGVMDMGGASMQIAYEFDTPNYV